MTSAPLPHGVKDRGTAAWSRMSLSPCSLPRLILRSHASKKKTHNSSVRTRSDVRKAGDKRDEIGGKMRKGEGLERERMRMDDSVSELGEDMEGGRS